MFGTEQCDEIGSTLNPCLTLKENCVYQVSPRNPSRKALLHFIQRDECDKEYTECLHSGVSQSLLQLLIFVPKFAKCFYTRERL